MARIESTSIWRCETSGEIATGYWAKQPRAVSIGCLVMGILGYRRLHSRRLSRVWPISINAYH